METRMSLRPWLGIARTATLMGLIMTRGRMVARLGFAAAWLYPTLRRNCSWHGPVVRRLREPDVWLTIDDGPDARCAPAFLELLAARGIRASFFAIGRQVARHPGISREIIAAGHTLENHTFSHPAGRWWALPRHFIREEMRQASDVIAEVTGTSPQWFRNPVGMCPWGVHPAARTLGLRVAGWSAAGGDGCRRAPSESLEKIARALRPGAIVLIHAGDRPRHRLILLTRLLDEIERRGLHCAVPNASLYNG